MQSMKETAANMAASAKSGLEKTKATVQEKAEKLTSHDPIQKDTATQRKEERINQAELNKQEARDHNAAAKQAGSMGGTTGGYTTTGTGAYTTTGPGATTYSTTGAHGHPTGTHQMSALPGHGTGQPTGGVTEGVVGSHPIGTNIGTGGTPGHATHVGGNAPGYGTGGTTGHNTHGGNAPGYGTGGTYS